MVALTTLCGGATEGDLAMLGLLIRDSIKKSLVETRGYDAGGDDIAQFDADFSIMSAELAEFVEQLLGSMDS